MKPRTSRPTKAADDSASHDGQQQQRRHQSKRAPLAQPSPASTGANALAMKHFVEVISLDVDLDTARSLDVRGKGIAALPHSLGAILKNVRKLDLGGNNITDVAPLSSLPFLSNLNLSNNTKLNTLHSLACTKLVVLSVANCGLTSLKGVECCAGSLRTLIANDNMLQLQAPAEQRQAPRLPAEVRATPTHDVALGNYLAIGSLTACETVVLTRNPTLCTLYPTRDAEGDEDGQGKRKPHNAEGEAAGERDAEDTDEDEEESEAARQERQQTAQLLAAAHPLSLFEKLEQLKKLSLSDCNLNCLPARWFLPMVTELRLARNQLRSLRPDGVIVRSLKTLDVSHNRLSSMATLRRCRYVQQLNVRGNPFVDIYVARDREEEENVAAAGVKRKAAAAKEEGAAEREASHPSSVPLSLQRSLKHMLTQLTAVDGQPLLEESELVFRRRPRQRDSDGAGGDEGKPPGQRSVKRTRSEADAPRVKGADVDSLAEETEKPPQKGRRTAPALRRETRAKPARDAEALVKVRAEAEEKDVVIEAPAVVMKETHAPIIRRERTARVATQKNVALSGEAAVAALRKRKTEAQGW